MKKVSSNATIPQDSLLCSFFEKAKENPYHTAFEDKVSLLTYAELQEQIFSVAGHLHRQDVENKTLCILGGKESGTVAAAMGAWLCGWSFFIIDEHFPIEKINKLYDLIKPSCTLIANAVGEYPDNIISEILKRDHVFFVKDFINIRLDKEAKSTIIKDTSCGGGEDIALYTLTSGTTGTPKAVAISHRAWTYAVKKQVKNFKYKTHERVAIQSRFACDGIFDALCAFSVTGTAVLVVSDLFYDTKAWVNTIEQKKISCLPIISSIVQLIAADKEYADMPSCVEKIIFAGDFIHPTVIQFLKEYCAPSVAIYNLYGSSEDFYILSKRINLDQPDQAGCFELPNEQESSTQIKLTSIKNSDTNLLSIKSQSLFSGYLTNHKTLDLPLDLFGYFCTGDLFKKHNNGLVLAGRFDRQIKWCGYRIEPEEIERALCENEGITEACLYVGDIPEQEEALICAIVSDLPEDSLEKIVRHTVAIKVYTEYKDDVVIHKVKTLPRKKKIR